MSKPVHPIRKLCNELDRRGYDYEAERAIIARHVKPLLDALEEAQSGLVAFSAGATADTIIKSGKLLNAWRAKL